MELTGNPVAEGLPTCARQDDPQASKDTQLLNWLRDNTCDLRCVPTAEDDYDWVVIEHHQQAPHEREIGRGFSYDPRDAILAAQAHHARGAEADSEVALLASRCEPH